MNLLTLLFVSKLKSRKKYKHNGACNYGGTPRNLCSNNDCQIALCFRFSNI